MEKLTEKQITEMVLAMMLLVASAYRKTIAAVTN
jgi:hypothetical protein